ncbi:MAG: phenylalanine--tRNA ligase subunit beta, partial [Dehalococcoidia bacterium]|nr:phenylalanine--tRNA ligase subunit beta [Dehalococcoidia bacterium]
MKIPLNWLCDYVDISLPLEEIAEKLTMAGIEVSKIITVGDMWDNIIVGEITAIEPHPNADRLRLASLNLGKSHITVVCGAPNLTLGDKVPLAHVGASVFDTRSETLVNVKKAKIRGVLSQGMICSESELGISDNHEGIMVLPKDTPIGTSLKNCLGKTVFDLEITPNRPDCLSLIGIAREVAALTGQSVHLPQISYLESDSNIDDLISVEIEDKDLCSRYCASLITDIEVKPSPQWMQQRLLACGMQPINNVVDATNYVMLEYGQPLHAFDYKQIGEPKIVVRRAKEGEPITSLDNTKRYLNQDILVIANRKKPIAIAGIMGGVESGINANTTSVLLEAASFNPANIRRTANKLMLHSEAS